MSTYEDERKPLLEENETTVAIGNPKDGEPVNRSTDDEKPLLDLPSAEHDSIFKYGYAEIKETLGTLVMSSLPLVVIYFTNICLRNLSLSLVKGLNDPEVTNAIGIGNALINIVVIVSFYSLNFGLTAAGAQAFGAQNNRLMGIYFHRSLIINFIIFIPICCLLLLTEKIALSFGFNEETAHHVHLFCAWSIISFPFMIIKSTIQAYLFAGDLFWGSAIIEVICTGVFTGLSIVFVNQADLGVVGVALGLDVMQIVCALMMFLYVKIKDPIPGSFFWFKDESFQELWSFLKFEFSVGSMLSLEWIYYEIIYLFSGGLKAAEISAYTILVISVESWYTVPMALGDTALVYMGNAIGEGNTRKAKNYFYSGMILSLIFTLITEIFYVFLARENAAFYTNDEDTITITIRLFRIFMLFYPFEYSHIILSAGIRVLGKEELGTTIALVSYYVISLPLIIVLYYGLQFGLDALLTGFMASTLIKFTWLVVVYYQLDWQKQVEIVQAELIADDEKTQLQAKALKDGEDETKELLA